MNRDEALKQSDEALKELAQSLSQGMSDKLLNYLAAMARFHQYSFGNCIMIYMQKPDATQVAGFGKWKEMNRFVKKGEKGIAIFAPMVGKKKKDSDAKDASSANSNHDSSETPDSTNANKVLYGFRVVYVFDVSQTEGQELPEFAALGGDPGDKIERLIEIYRNQGPLGTPHIFVGVVASRIGNFYSGGRKPIPRIKCRVPVFLSIKRRVLSS